MYQTRSQTTTGTTCLFSLLVSFYIFSLYTTDQGAAFHGSIVVVQLAGAFLVAAFLIVAIKATIVTWITVLVLLTFAGKRRRVLVAEGMKITSDIAMYLFKVMIKERGLFAVACATIISLMAWLA